jgi:hypothetical protein
MEIVIIPLIVFNAYLFWRLKRLEKNAVTGKEENKVVTLHLNGKPFNQLKSKSQ